MAARGRYIGFMGETFIGTDHGAAAPAVGQPVMVRMQGVPTMPGYRDRPGKWNMRSGRAVRDWLRRLTWRTRPTRSGA